MQIVWPVRSLSCDALLQLPPSGVTRWFQDTLTSQPLSAMVIATPTALLEVLLYCCPRKLFVFLQMAFRGEVVQSSLHGNNWLRRCCSGALVSMFLGDFFVDGSLVWACHGDGMPALTPFEWWPSLRSSLIRGGMFLPGLHVVAKWVLHGICREAFLLGGLAAFACDFASSSSNLGLHRMLVRLSMRGWLCTQHSLGMASRVEVMQSSLHGNNWPRRYCSGAWLCILPWWLLCGWLCCVGLPWRWGACSPYSIWKMAGFLAVLVNQWWPVSVNGTSGATWVLHSSAGRRPHFWFAVFACGLRIFEFLSCASSCASGTVNALLAMFPGFLRGRVFSLYFLLLRFWACFSRVAPSVRLGLSDRSPRFLVWVTRVSAQSSDRPSLSVIKVPPNSPRQPKREKSGIVKISGALCPLKKNGSFIFLMKL